MESTVLTPTISDFLSTFLSSQLTAGKLWVTYDGARKDPIKQPHQLDKI